MADFQTAFTNTLVNYEDSRPSGKVTPEPSDWICVNGHTVSNQPTGPCSICSSAQWKENKYFARFGINSKAHPNMPDEFWTGPVDQALPMAQSVYKTGYWDPLQLDDILNQALANKIYDMGVNMSIRTSATLSQRAVVALGAAITVDGMIGPRTIAVLNALPPGAVHDELVILSVAHYVAVEKIHPADMKWDASWMARARA